MIQVSTEVLVALSFGAAGLAAAIGRIMFVTGKILSTLETRSDVHEKQLAKHGIRIGKLESQT